ncbi:MAG: adenosylcobalamin-dependent ribonucleoside-diphosphate reductase, partial [Deltaproteobacteria bacterium]|nr:adenosylcobalamin-dependent ribonucleoside-diphosphate reductase [Deltaproteobacteria bacterium]
KTGVPAKLQKVQENGVPDWLCRSEPDWNELQNLEENLRFTSERSVKQVVLRLAGSWTYWGFKFGYFKSELSAWNFFEAIVLELLGQFGAPNSPQLINTGLWWAYGMTKEEEGFYRFDTETGQIQKSECSYKHPTVSACFIIDVEDKITGEGGIYDLVLNEAKIFKFGAGSGVNFSRLRSKSEKISTGINSSGVLEFIKLSDYSASCIKSGGIERGSSKMAVLNISHPDIEDFCLWKTREEISNWLHSTKQYSEALQNLISCSFANIEETGIEPSKFFVRSKFSGNNTNVSVAIPDSFFRALEDDKDWKLKSKNGFEISVSARKIWNTVCFAAWFCGDPGVQYSDTINRWNTCKNSGFINASNPCSEYLFLDNTACTLASLNLKKFFDDFGNFDLERFLKSVRLWIQVLDISLSFAQYPTRKVCENTYLYRTIGLGFTNLGSLLMSLGISYESEEAEVLSALLTWCMTCQAYLVSSDIARELCPFPKFEENKNCFKDVLEAHVREYEKLKIKLKNLNIKEWIARTIKDITAWLDNASKQLLRSTTFRNAQVTCIAPTGTISFIMDAETTGIEPEYSLFKFKKLSDGGRLILLNDSFKQGLQILGYSSSAVEDIEKYVLGHKTLVGAPHINHSVLTSFGFDVNLLDHIERLILTEASLRNVFKIKNFDPEIINQLGIKTDTAVDKNTCLLDLLGFSNDQILQAEKFCFGHGSIVGAPNLKSEHYPVFKVAVSSHPDERISVEGHVKIVAACQKFVSGGISKTINLTRDSTVDEVSNAFLYAWKSGCKSITVYREGSKVDQPLNLLSQSVSTQSNFEVSKKTRKPLPMRRSGFTQKVRLGGQKVYLRTGEYEDGQLGEIFIDLSKEGAALRSIMNHFAIAVSIGLQYGVPLEEYVDAFIFTKYEPSGPVVGSPYIKTATSISDYIFRELAIHYLNRKDLAHVNDKFETDNSITQRGVNTKLELSNEALGFEGEACPECGNFTLIRSGSCLKCVTCGYSTGCS